MDLTLLGYAGALLMGVSLGLLGGGGSILTVPVLVYLFRVDPVLATAYSLFTVGLTSLIGALSHFRLGNIHLRTAVLFGTPSIAGVYLVRAFVVPAIPAEIVSLGDLLITKGLLLLLLFALLMLAASYSMIRKPRATQQSAVKGKSSRVVPLIMAEGLVVGGITGLVGAGGGFLIIPALVLLTRLPMKQAVGTSLTIIAAKSLLGFLGDLRGDEVIDWGFLALFSFVAIAGIVAGSRLSAKVSNEKLKPAFGWFVLGMGIFILVKELVFRA